MSQSPVISVEELCQQPNGETLIVDCRFSLMDKELGRKQYDLGHVPGAYYVHLDDDMAGVTGKHGGRHPLPKISDFVEFLNRMGMQKDMLVVAYDDSNFAFASRFWWMLRYLGHDDVAVLDGGFRAWQFSGGAIDCVAPALRVGSFNAAQRSNWVLNREHILDRIEDPALKLVDSREEARFKGLEEPIDPIAGSIPGALNFPWQEVTDESGFVRPVDFQVNRWKPISIDDQMVAYCGSGVTACVNLISWEMAGRSAAMLYPGSWSDWCSYEGVD